MENQRNHLILGDRSCDNVNCNKETYGYQPETIFRQEQAAPLVNE